MLPVTSLPPNLVPPGAVPGLPGQPPAAPQLAATPPIPGQQNTDEVKNRIMQAMQQISQQRQLAMRPVVPNLPARQDPNAVPGYMQGPNWGPERFLKQSSALIHNAARKMQETRIQKAESDWNALAAAVETNNQSLMNAILSDPRKVKNMAKVFQMDWLNPKPTPHSIALSRVAQQTGLRDQAKKNFFVRLFHALRGNGQQQPYSPQQIQEIESKLPIRSVPNVPALAEMDKIDQESEANHLKIAQLVQTGQLKEAELQANEQNRRYQRQIAMARLQIEQDKNKTERQKDEAIQELNSRKLREEERHNKAMEGIEQRRALQAKTTATQDNLEKSLAKLEEDKDSKLAQLEAQQKSKTPLSPAQLRQAKQDIQNGYEAALKRLGQNVTHYEYPDPAAATAVEGSTGTVRGIPVIRKGGKWVAQNN
jgi:hypothetical protein